MIPSNHSPPSSISTKFPVLTNLMGAVLEESLAKLIATSSPSEQPALLKAIIASVGLLLEVKLGGQSTIDRVKA
jgi:hypothetical protein